MQWMCMVTDTFHAFNLVSMVYPNLVDQEDSQARPQPIEPDLRSAVRRLPALLFRRHTPDTNHSIQKQIIESTRQWMRRTTRRCSAVNSDEDAEDREVRAASNPRWSAVQVRSIT